MREPFFRLLSVGLLGFGATCSLVANATPVDCGATVPSLRTSYFTKIGIGADYGPHYPCYDIMGGAIDQCLNNDGTPKSGVQTDAKNNEIQSSVPLDLTQLQLAGFKSVRAYGDPAKVWIAMINAANDVNLNVVYQVSTCKSDAAVSNHPCVNVPGQNFQNVLAFSLAQLRQVITQVTPAVFQKVVKLIIVGNEDLVISPTDHQTYNTLDLIAAIQATKLVLVSNNVKVTSGLGGTGVDLSSATVIGQMTTPPGILLATAYTPGAPVIENVYGAQFSFVMTPADAVTFLKNEVNKMQAQYQYNPAMLGETGWWTQGQDAGYDASTRVGTLADAKAYYQGLYPYLTSCSVPTLIFEAFDQPQKGPSDATKPNPPGALEAEQYYGVMSPFNTAKDRALLPSPAPSYQDHPETANAALFTFVLAEPVGTAPAMTFGVQQPGQNSPTKVTLQPFAQIINNMGGTTPVWPTFNLYLGSKMFLFRSATQASAQCSNTVASIFTTSQVDPVDMTKYVPPFSGGLWVNLNQTAPGCLQYTPTNVNWGNGNQGGNYAQNVFLSAEFPTLSLSRRFGR